MKKHTVIILAGGEKGPLYEPTGYKIKALIPIHGKPMIDWVVESFAQSPLVENIVVVGDGLKFAAKFAKAVKGKMVKFHRIPAVAVIGDKDCKKPL